jgi:hypothetical protein
MMSRLLLALFLIVATGLSAAAEEKPEGDFARVELRGKLTEWTFHLVDRNQYAVAVERKAGPQTFVLEFSDEAVRKEAKGLLGQTVVVTGEVSLGSRGNGFRKETVTQVMVVSVKTLKKAEPPAKK